MADRRTYRAQRKFEAEPPDISGKEYQALKAIARGYASTEAARRVLSGKGLVSSPIASKVYITRRGQSAIARYERPLIIAATVDPPVPTPRIRWEVKHKVRVRPGIGW